MLAAARCTFRVRQPNAHYFSIEEAEEEKEEEEKSSQTFGFVDENQFMS